MLDRMTPEQFAEWRAKDKVEPIGYATRALGLIAYQMAVYMAGEKADQIDEKLYMPWMKYEAKPEDKSAAMAKFSQVFNALAKG